MSKDDGPAASVAFRLARAVAADVAILVVGLGLMLAAHPQAVPARLNPFADLDIRESPGLFISFKLTRARNDAGLCRSALTRAGIPFDPVDDQVTGDGCGYAAAVRIARVGRAALSSPALLSCRAALSLAMLEAHGLSVASQEHLGSPVVRIDHLGTYACRNINHAPTGRRSRHATGDAIDLGGFVLADGRRITLVRDWASAEAGRSAFLRAARDHACRWFDVTLSPLYNSLHRDHLHLDIGGGRACR